MLVVVSGADLFTSTVLIVIAKASGRISWGQLGANWLNCLISATGITPLSKPCASAFWLT